MAAIVLFALVLFVMGGVTAYMGDKLGSKIGKKRYSTFGLRPRHTAMLWTIISGGAIAVGTLLLLLLLGSDYKTALLRGPQLIAENERLDHQNSILTRRDFAMGQQVQADGILAARAEAQADRAQKTLASVSAELGQAKDSLVRSRAILASRQATLAGAQRRLHLAQANLGSTRQELALAAAQVRAARRGVAAAQQQFQIASSEVVQANKSVLDLVIKQDSLHAENAKLTAGNQTLVAQNKIQQGLLQVSEGHTVVFRRGEELARTIVSANQPPEILRHELAVFLDQMELTARQRGAGGTDNVPAVTIPAADEGSESASAAREDALDALTQNIADEAAEMPSVVIVADARYNTFHGETVTLDLRPYANVKVFAKGAVIASDVLDGSQPEDVILKNLQSFLANQVRTIALDSGIIPIHDPQSGEPMVGQPIDSDKWLSWVKRIQQAGPNALVVASVTEDTYSGDQMRLDLSVPPAGSAPAPPSPSSPTNGSATNGSATNAAVQE